jgi:hypothetical protein
MHRLRRWLLPSALLSVLGIAHPAYADQTQDLLSLRNTLVGVLEQLVKSGVVSEADARAIVDKAQTEALAEAQKSSAAEPPAGPDTVRVTYVPQIVKDELRQQVKSELRDEVSQEVREQARQEGWGVPGGLPAWITDITWRADVRVRSESVLFASNNTKGYYLNFQAINNAGGIAPAGENALLNVSEDVHQMTERLRFGLETRLSDGWSMAARVSTGNEGNPVTRNAQLGQYDAPWDAFVDLAYAQYRSKYLLFSGGRFPNPFLSTNLVFDDDLTFEGLAATGFLPFELGGADDRAYLTAGYFPLDQIELSSRDKYLLGAQLGGQFGIGGSSLGVGVAYYDFANVNGTRNQPGSTTLDYTAPSFVQKGNTMFDIRNDLKPDTGLFALAAQYRLVDVSFVFDSGPLSLDLQDAIHVKLTGDYVTNVGYDEQDILRATGTAVPGKTDGYQLELSVGMNDIDRFGKWRIATAFRHLERDAVLDAFTDSDFHRGGTDAEGWSVDALYGLARNTWMRLRYMTANEISGPPLGIDVLQLDLNTKF